MKKSPPFRAFVELLGVHIARNTIPFLPRGVVCGLAGLASRIAFCFGKRAVKVGRANLDLVYGDEKTQDEKDAILRGSLRQAALIALDLFWFSRFSVRRLNRWIHHDESLDSYFTGKPQLAITGHLGNWEILGQAVSNWGFPLMSVAAPLANKKVDAIFLKMRERTGQTIVPQDGAIRKILKGLQGDAKMAVLLDQNMLPMIGGVYIDFFGTPAPIGTFPISMAVRTGCEMILGFCLPEPDGSYLIASALCIQAPKQTKPDPETVKDLTRQIVAAYEKQILKRPECWMWSYKRWKYIPDDCTDTSSFPFYARLAKPREQSMNKFRR